VIEKRDTDKESVVRRRRECSICSKRFTTYERAEVLDLFIIKKDQRREIFDRQKLRISLTKACEKRPIKHEKLESLVSEVEQKLIRIRRTDIESGIVGEIVMDLLKEIDESLTFVLPLSIEISKALLILRRNYKKFQRLSNP